MGRNYAGILGLLAFVIAILRGAIAGGAPESTLLHASTCLLVFAVIGLAVGHLAQWIVDDSVQDKVSREMAASESAPEESRPQTG